MPTSVALRRSLVADLEKRRAIRSEAVRDAFLSVPRELFVPDHARTDGLAAVYRDDAIVTKKDARGVPISSSSQPGIMAPMLDMLRLEPGLRVLEVGAGTGYNAALIKSIVGSSGRVTTVDVDPDIARGGRAALRRADTPVRVVNADGRTGFRAGAPFDRIIVTASAQRIAPAWRSQLREGGVLVVPLWLHDDDSTSQFVLAFQRSGSILRSIEVVAGGFMTIRSRGGDGISAVRDRLAVAASEWQGMNGSAVCTLFGPGLRRLSGRRRRAILATALTDGARRRRLPDRTSALGLRLFMVLSASQSRLVTYHRPAGWGIGVIDPLGRGFSVLTTSTNSISTRRAAVVLESFGSRHAERDLMRLLKQWRALGCPDHRDLILEVHFGTRAPSAWRRQHRGKQILTFDWKTARA